MCVCVCVCVCMCVCVCVCVYLDPTFTQVLHHKDVACTFALMALSPTRGKDLVEEHSFLLLETVHHNVGVKAEAREEF